MKKYLHWMSHLIEEFDNVKLELIPREENLSADKVARISLTKDALATEGLLMDVQKISNIDGYRPFRFSNQVTGWNQSYPILEMANSHLTYQRQRRSESEQQDSLF